MAAEESQYTGAGRGSHSHRVLWKTTKLESEQENSEIGLTRL